MWQLVAAFTFTLSQGGWVNDVQRDGFCVRGVVEPTSGTPYVWRLSCYSYYKAETRQTSSRSRCRSPNNSIYQDIQWTKDTVVLFNFLDSDLLSWQNDVDGQPFLD